MVKAMIKREEDNVQQEDIRFGQGALEQALWRLSLVLRDIAAMDDEAEEPKNIERKEPPRQLLTEGLTAGDGECKDAEKQDL
ncbi:hypothetical protein ES703_41247 [subsurface metagenome]